MKHRKQLTPCRLPANPAKPRAFLNEAGLYDYGVKSLGRAMRTEAELRRLMKTRVEPGERGEAVIDAVVARLKEQRYLDDQSLPRPTPACARRTKSSASGASGRTCSRRA